MQKNGMLEKIDIALDKTYNVEFKKKSNSDLDKKL